MKVAAAACIFCLILTVVNGSLLRVPSKANYVDGTMYIMVDGKWVTQCSVDWGGSKYTSTVGDGQELHLPSVNGGYCYDCGECTQNGMECAQDYMGGPGCPSYFD